jgi:anti-sigma factor RsiW
LMTDDDADLVALIDNELDENRKKALLARLETDERLRERYEALREIGAPIAASFDALLRQAPIARLCAGLPLDGPARASSQRFAGVALRELAAGIAIGLLAASVAAWVALSLAPIKGKEDWRTAVVDYTNLYTNETFSPLNPDLPLQAVELSAVGDRVGANLTPDNIALPGLRFTVAFMLAFERFPLGVIAYVDREGAPVLLCIIANQAPDAAMRSEKRGDLSLAWWSRGGRSYLVIGRMPEERAVALAQTLEKRV